MNVVFSLFDGKVDKAKDGGFGGNPHKKIPSTKAVVLRPKLSCICAVRFAACGVTEARPSKVQGFSEDQSFANACPQ